MMGVPFRDCDYTRRDHIHPSCLCVGESHSTSGTSFNLRLSANLGRSRMCDVRRNVCRGSSWPQLWAALACAAFIEGVSCYEGCPFTILEIERNPVKRNALYRAPWPFLSRVGDSSSVGRPML